MGKQDGRSETAEDHGKHRPWRSQPERQAAGYRCSGARSDHGTKRDHYARQEIDRNFKIRKGMPIGCAVTLRGEKMYEFLDRLCNVVLPRVRDFRGLPSNAFDGRGNYTM